MALSAVRENGDGKQDGSERQLAAGEDRPRRDAELMLTRLAFEQRAGLVFVHAKASAARAIRFAATGGPTDLTERVGGLFVRHAGDPSQAQGPRRCRNEESAET